MEDHVAGWMLMTSKAKFNHPKGERGSMKMGGVIEMLLAELVGRVAIGNSNVDVYYSIFHLNTFILFHNCGDRLFMCFKQCAQRSIY
jgi:hypothetical protein